MLIQANEALVTELGSMDATLEATRQALHSAIDESTAAQNVLMSMLGKTATVPGHTGMVSVKAVVDDQGVIVCLEIDVSGEERGQLVLDPRFVEPFKGETLPLILGEDVDAVSGATITSQAVVNALNTLTPEYATPHDNLPAAQ